MTTDQIDLAAIRARLSADRRSRDYPLGGGALCSLCDGDGTGETIARRTLLKHAPADLAALCDGYERVTAERDALREIIAGRTRPPTDAEIEAHAKVGGSFRWHRPEHNVAIIFESDVTTSEPYDGFAFGVVVLPEDVDDDAAADGTRWWARDASGAPCAWPVVTEVERG